MMEVNLDISKVYDRVEWAHLNVILRKMGFEGHWSDRVLSCVTFVDFDVIVNGELVGQIVPKCGLWQRDLSFPLSIYSLCKGFKWLN